MEVGMNKINSAVCRFMLGIILVVLMCSNLDAQPRQGRGRSVSALPPHEFFPPVPNQLEINKLMDDLEIDLALNREQKVRIKSIYEDHFNQVKQLRPGPTTIYDEMEHDHENLQLDLLRKVAGVLDDYQLERYMVFLEQRSLGREGHEFIDDEEGNVPDDEFEDGDCDHEDEFSD